MLYNFYSANTGNGIWETVNDTKDEEATALCKTLHTKIQSSLANFTNNRHFSGWKKWVEWCKTKQEVLLIHFIWLYISIVFSSQKITRVLLLTHSMVLVGAIT